jgi:hypothetical protein
VLPAQLTPESFASYPAEARSLAQANLDLIQQFPLVFAALLLHEVSGYDWRFPAERRMIDDQFTYLRSLSPAARDRILHGFSLSTLPPTIAQIDWLAHSQDFIDEFTAYLWSAHQIGSFRNAADEYQEAWRKAIPEPVPTVPRLIIVVLGEDLKATNYQLFRKLRPYGVFFPSINSDNSLPSALAAATSRAKQLPSDFGHWYLDGGSFDSPPDPNLSCLSWSDLKSVRAAILTRMRSVIESGHGGPEELRTLMIETTPEEVGFPTTRGDDVLGRFKISVLTEGSGTQIFSTTFVQWAAREILRRAQPYTFVIRYAPRQRQLPMNELLSDTGDRNSLDPEGSLIDADMGAFYTWINQQRLTGADQSCFVAWSEAHREAIAIGPGLPKATVSTNVATLKQILGYFT